MSDYIASPQEIRDGIEHYKRIMKEEKERELIINGILPLLRNSAAYCARLR